ncbi:MAG TPA: Dam family site-specific DNA-(adenine-N6)-methyltransferase, partial [Pyrinomonadaceae bacterium]|nr:Dam family site-specific DNA-(adenine-N6)-methyltransferase [Pyrinomonadaceae bacterium]
MVKPPLKWAGGKRWLVSHVAPLWEQHKHRRYVEPFCGGLAVALGLQPQRALLNDVNPHLVNFYRHLQTGLKLTIAMRYDEKLFYQHRAHFNALIRNGGAKSDEAAQLFYYLNRTGFNGLCRFNKSGEFNVPFGTYTRINYDVDFSGYPSALKQWTFTSVDVEKVPLKKGDFVY